jgi:membrane fusion protein (multidrug efflux system)
VSDKAHVDFTVAQRVAAGLHVGDSVAVISGPDSAPISASIVAIDARVDPATRNAMVRARIPDDKVPAPGASVRVLVPAGAPGKAVAIPVSALRKGPGGDEVFVITPDKNGKQRAHVRQVRSGEVNGDTVLIHAGLKAGELVATSGSFKLRDSVLVVLADSAQNQGAMGAGVK